MHKYMEIERDIDTAVGADIDIDDIDICSD